MIRLLVILVSLFFLFLFNNNTHGQDILINAEFGKIKTIIIYENESLVMKYRVIEESEFHPICQLYMWNKTAKFPRKVNVRHPFLDLKYIRFRGHLDKSCSFDIESFDPKHYGTWKIEVVYYIKNYTTNNTFISTRIEESGYVLFRTSSEVEAYNCTRLSESNHTITELCVKKVLREKYKAGTNMTFQTVVPIGILSNCTLSHRQSNTREQNTTTTIYFEDNTAMPRVQWFNTSGTCDFNLTEINETDYGFWNITTTSMDRLPYDQDTIFTQTEIFTIKPDENNNFIVESSVEPEELLHDEL